MRFLYSSRVPFAAPVHNVLRGESVKRQNSEASLALSNFFAIDPRNVLCAADSLGISEWLWYESVDFHPYQSEEIGKSSRSSTNMIVISRNTG